MNIEQAEALVRSWEGHRLLKVSDYREKESLYIVEVKTLKATNRTFTHLYNEDILNAKQLIRYANKLKEKRER